MTAEQQPPEEQSAPEDLAAPVYLKNLIILPPLQKDGALQGEDFIDGVPLPPIPAEESINSIRQAISEIRGYSHITSYRFELEPDGPAPKKLAHGRAQGHIISPYTGPNAVVSSPASLRSLEDDPQLIVNDESLVLDDYGDLTPYLTRGLKDGSALRIVLEKYDVASVRDHINRLRSILAGNTPSSTSLDDGSASEENNSEQGAGSDKQEEGAKNAKDTKEDEVEKLVRELPKYKVGEKVTPNGKNLKDFFYLVAGEDPSAYGCGASTFNTANKANKDGGSKKKKNKKNKSDTRADAPDNENKQTVEATVNDIIPKLNKLEEVTRIPCSIRMGGFHPPPRSRRLLGDQAYLEVTLPQSKSVIHITAQQTGFYVNRSIHNETTTKFDPSPASNHCFSHELLDCILTNSQEMRDAWDAALQASLERVKLMETLNKDGPFASLFRIAIRSDFDGYSKQLMASPADGIDALLQKPSWVVHQPSTLTDWLEPHHDHSYDCDRTENELSSTFGVDVRSGAVRDWNEELQSAREMPVVTHDDRVERARVMNKLLIEFGQASLTGVKAICDGQIFPMNPNEAARSQVYLHNNIFFSRAIDAGVETFKVAKGDKAARKSASRDVQSLGSLHRMDRNGLYTLATVLIDYLGTRYVCQSILPGILSGEKTHTLLYGAVEAGSPLAWDKETHDTFEDTLGKSFMIATRTQPRNPLSEVRSKEIEEIKNASPLYYGKTEDGEEKIDLSPTIPVCAPIEAKGIQGSDHRKYVLDMTRLTPRDANWVPERDGGTGKWEAEVSKASSLVSSKKASKIPDDIFDEEWTLAILRPELITSHTQSCMTKYLSKKREQKKSEADEQEAASKAKDKEANTEDRTKSEKEAKKEKSNSESPNSLSEEDLAHLKSLRLNINVFLPDIRSLEGVDEEAAAQVANDEEMTRGAARFLWDEVMPKLTAAVREGSSHQLPHDGQSLTDFVHQFGVNCRYMGHLATMAQDEEAKDFKQMEDLKKGNPTLLNRRKIPKFWLELLESEMVARAAKHVLDSYLTENMCAAAARPAQTIASFFSALVSEVEETAAQTESRIEMESKLSLPDEDDLNALVLSDVGGSGDAIHAMVKSRSEIWEDIETEIGRRFRYKLTMYNQGGKTSRALHAPLLRRICQKTGVRLAGKNYDLGARCLCSGGGTSSGQLSKTYPISPLDIIDIMPLMKHAAAHGAGFMPCGIGPTSGIPPLHVSLPDARTALEAAHAHHRAKNLQNALELAQEAAGLYTRATETSVHPGVVRCIDLMASILFDAGQPAAAAANAEKSLGLLVQIHGFDSPEVISAHVILFQMLMTAGQISNGVKHLRAALYLMELLGGPRNIELSSSYHKLGTVYHQAGQLATALQFYTESAARDCSDRLLEGMISKSTAIVFASLGEYKMAVESERSAFRTFSLLLGEEHSLTKTSDQTLKKFMQMAVEHGNKQVEVDKMLQQSAAAELIANEIEAAEAAEAERKKKKNKKKRGKK